MSYIAAGLDLGPGDDVALYRFDSRVQSVVALDEVAEGGLWRQAVDTVLMMLE